MCYHVGISPLGGLVDSFSQLYFTINLEEIFYFNNKKNAVFMRILAFRKRLNTLKYLKEKDRESLVNLSSILDDYVRRVFKKVIAVEELNYNDIPEEKAYVRKYFTDLAKMFYSE